MSTDQPNSRYERAVRDIVDGIAPDAETSPGLRLIARLARAYRETGGGAVRPPPAFMWGPLQVYEKIGSGAFGDVFRAWDPRLEVPVALKFPNAAIGGRDLLTEARQLARIRHPHVITVRGADVDDGRVGVWFDLVNGETLAKMIESGPMPIRDVASIVESIARAVNAVHEAGFVHGDIKAENVLLDEHQRPILIDFGSMRPLDDDSDIVALTGSPLSSAPELLRGSSPTVGADVYALGALFFHLVTGGSVIDAETIDDVLKAHRLGRRASLAEHCPTMSVSLAEAVDRTLAPHPADRFETADGFADAIARSVEPPHNLPAARTRLIGRASELETIGAAIDAARLVSLVGPGGVGKTRLATETARKRVMQFPGGTWWIELVDVAPGAIASAVADVLKIRDTGGAGESLSDTLANALDRRRTLVVLDNCEHVVDEVATFAHAILERTSHAAILTTSRERLRLTEERVVNVTPLSTVNGADDGITATVSDAAALFIERAEAASTPIAVDAPAAGLVFEIAQAVDGMPLALELAASLLSTHSLAEVAAQCRDHIAALRADTRDVPDRHRTMEAVVGWSARSLAPGARTLFSELAVFRDGWDEPVARELSTLDDPSFARAHRDLIERSLIWRSRSDDRFRMLEPIRAVAVAQVEPDAFDRHISVFRDHLHGLRSADYTTPMDERHRTFLEREYENLRAARRRAVTAEAWTDAAVLTDGLHLAWIRKGHYREEREACDEIWDNRDRISDPDLRASVWLNAGMGANDTGRLKDARRFLEAIRDEIANGAQPSLERRVVSNLGVTAQRAGEFAEAERLYEQSLRLAEAGGDELSIAIAQANLAVFARFRGALDDAARLFSLAERTFRKANAVAYGAKTAGERGITAFWANDLQRSDELLRSTVAEQRELGERPQLAYTLTMLAALRLHQRNNEAAEALATEAADILRGAGQSPSAALDTLGKIEYERGNIADAEAFFVRSFEHEHGKPGDVESAARNLALPAAARERHHDVVFLAAIATHLRDPRKGPPNPGLQRLMDQVGEKVLLARASLDAAEIAEIESDARSLTFDVAANRIFAMVPNTGPRIAGTD